MVKKTNTSGLQNNYEILIETRNPCPFIKNKSEVRSPVNLNLQHDFSKRKKGLVDEMFL